MYSGSYCQCDDYSCPFYNLRICSGQGHCVCGRCECMEGYAGPVCGCPTTSCMTANGKVCNGYGDCVCGHCQCSSSSFFKGPTCEECPTCPGQCVQFLACAQCKAFGTGGYNREECDSNCPDVQIVDFLDRNNNNYKGDESLCQIQDDDACRFYFTFRRTSDIRSQSIKVRKARDCPDNEKKSGDTGAANGFQLGIVAMVLRSVCGVILHKINRE